MMDVPKYSTAVEEGEVTHRAGHHHPEQNKDNHMPCCGCDLTTRNGAYRDVSVSLGDRTIHYYHQSPVVVEGPEGVLVDSCGWKTKSTKERINRYLPSGMRLIQRDGDWFLNTPTERTEFTDGMLIKEMSFRVTG